MKIGINTCLWQWPFNWQRVDIIKKVKDIGYDAVEMTVEDRSKKNIEIIRENLKKTNLDCIICSSFMEGNLISEDKDIVKKGTDYVIESIDLCEYFGSSILVGPTYGSTVDRSYLDSDIKMRAKEQCTKILKDIGLYAQKKNIKIAIEPLNRYESNFLNTAEEGIDLVSKINLKNVGLLLDTYHMNIEEKVPEEAVRNTGKYLFHLHAPENDRGTPGTGHVNWKAVADSLKQIDFNGYVVMESGSPKVEEVAALGAFWRKYDYSQDKMAVEGLHFLKEVLSN
jgi:D-psicose/D-tagatose/L-ribulose 3-epimerase